MGGIWVKSDLKWSELDAVGFQDEAALHDLVESAPQLLPLAGAPKVVIIGREVQLGPGRADLVGIEPSGRVVVIEVKLAANGEAKKAIVAQILSYAAFIHGMTADSFEGVLRPHLDKIGASSVLDAVKAAYQEDTIDSEAFNDGLGASLSSGLMRLVLVLDSAPVELMRLIGYLEAITEGLTVDLIAVSSYEIAGQQIVVPQRVDPERVESEVNPTPAKPASSKGFLVEGADDFIASIAEAPDGEREMLQLMCDWATSIQAKKLAKLWTAHSANPGHLVLLPRLQATDTGLATIWNYGGIGYLALWRSVIERYAPHSVSSIEGVIAPETLRQGGKLKEVKPEVLTVLTDAYLEANQTLNTTSVAL